MVLWEDAVVSFSHKLVLLLYFTGHLKKRSISKVIPVRFWHFWELIYQLFHF